MNRSRKKINSSNKISFKNNTNSKNIIRFHESSSCLMPGVNFNDEENNNDESISKSALLIVEGSHKDSKGRNHVFSRDHIEWFADATNDFMAKGGRVPWQQDHEKKQTANIGDLESELVTKVITYSDLPNSKLGHLVGKMGLFATNLVGKGKDVVEKIKNGNIKTLSPGIDMATGIIREISATPTPAIVGMSVFSFSGNNNAMTWEDLEEIDQCDDRLKEEYEQITDNLWQLTMNILGSSEEELPINDREKMFFEVLEGFGERFIELLGLNDEMNTDGFYTADEQDPTKQVNRQAEAGHQKNKLTLSANLTKLLNI